MDDQDQSKPVLDGIRLQEISPTQSEEDDDANVPLSTEKAKVDGIRLVAVRATKAVWPDGRLPPGGLPLANVGPTEIHREPNLSVAVPDALHITPYSKTYRERP